MNVSPTILFSVSVLSGLAAAYWFKRNPLASGILCVAAILTTVLGNHLWKKEQVLNYVPPSLGVTKVIYSKEESWGFGPGGNETGVLVYELPAAVLAELNKRGMDYLRGLPAGNGRFDEQERIEWRATPMPAEGDWVSREASSSDQEGIPRVSNYLSAYGFGIPIDAAIERSIDEAIRKPGSYFANGHVGVLILLPSRGWVVCAYNG